MSFTGAKSVAVMALTLFAYWGYFAGSASWYKNGLNGADKLMGAGIVSHVRAEDTDAGVPADVSPYREAHQPDVTMSPAQRDRDALGFKSSDCSGPTPGGYTRIFIAYRTDAKPGAGTASDPFDGSTVQKFDGLLRSRSESGVTHLVVCIGEGTFDSEGTYDYVLGRGHSDKKQPGGFTVNQGWRVHGAGTDRTILRLAGLYLDPSTSTYLSGLMIGTYDLGSYGVEVSDLTLDDNYPQLKPRYKTGLELQAIFLQSNRGRHWIHNVHVMNAAGEVAEVFPIEIGSPAPSPTESTETVVEFVTMDRWAGGTCTAIAVANSVSEVRYNTVIGYWGAYGGWQLSDVHFHDNYAVDTVYGFNIDSLQNNGVVISHNQIVHPQSYGIVIGGIGQFRNFSISDNTVTMAGKSLWKPLFGLILQGNVSDARVTGNKMINDGSSPAANVFGMYEKGDHNSDNTFQDNHISSSFQNSLKSGNCVHGNTSESGTPLRGLRDSQNGGCAIAP